MNKETTSSLSSSGSWTNEKHSNFLNSMESSFVRTMLGNKSRLNRYIPDSSDSTLDSKPNTYQSCQVPKIQINSSGPTRGKNMDGGSTNGSGRRVKSRPLNSSEDQVVPQFRINNVEDKYQTGNNKQLSCQVHQVRVFKRPES